jgi:pimeloyl-ACP methyl ester carboxylesterase
VPDDVVTPFHVRVPDVDLADLRERLARTRWPEQQPVPDWSQGVPLLYLQDLCRYWATTYDWRATEARLNAVPQYRTMLDGLGIHFLHVRSPHHDALPLVLTHGWPGSVLEFLEVVAPLTEPVAHGGAAEDAFHVIVPSLPGYGFSDKPTATGWGIDRTAQAWAQLMARLGYERYGAAGSDWGTSISSTLAQHDPAHVVGIHLIPPLAAPDPATFDDLTDAERAALADLDQRARTESAYSELHRTKPQTIGYALLDSPAALCAWLVEKLWTWTDHDGALSRDQLLDDVTLYWVTRTGASAARLYWESIEQVTRWLSEPGRDVVRVPTGCSVFAAEVPRPSRRWAARRYPDIRYWAEHRRGGHFPALEVPDLLVNDLRTFFRPLR